MALGLFRLAFLIMLERTLTEFMRGVFKAQILRHPLLDGRSSCWRWRWSSPASCRRPSAPAWRRCWRCCCSAASPSGSRGSPSAASTSASCTWATSPSPPSSWWWPSSTGARSVWVGSVSIHLFTFGAMGIIVPAMIVRISKGHTGRKVAFDAADKAVLWLMIAALALRVLAPQLFPAAYLAWIGLAAAGWFAAFALLAWRVIPFLLAPRIDGREH
jgi:uncharacterized protein involved in response to NO